MADTTQDIRPVPDPTVLTTEASIRLEAMIRNLIQSEIAHQNELFDVKLNGVKNTFDEKLAKIEIQLQMGDDRRAEQKQDTTKALSDALAAQKEQAGLQTAASEKSITKSETATTERIKGVETQLANSTKATDDKITDLKDRVIAIEAVKLGNSETTTSLRSSGTDMRGNIAIIISAIMMVIAIASVIVAVIIATKP